MQKYAEIFRPNGPFRHLIGKRAKRKAKKGGSYNLLVRKARRHDKDAFVKLMEQNGESMYKVAKAILKNDEDAADAMQETTLVCWEKIGMLREDRFFKTWMMRILINQCNAIYRQNSIAMAIPCL